MAAEPTPTPVEPSLAATGENVEAVDRANAPAAGPGGPATASPAPGGQPRLQDVLAEIKDLARRVGGMKKLAEIVGTLEKTKA
jgi:hypothetical protein